MLPVKITRRAAVEIRVAARWWSENRPRAPEAFGEDLRGALEILAHQPDMGANAASVRCKGVRRIHLSRVRYHLYYRVRAARIEVLALWHSSRGEEPNL